MKLELDKLISTMAPVLLPDTYVFCTLAEGTYGDAAHTQPIAAFTETEGLTLVMTQAAADTYHYTYKSTFRAITLTVNSSLDAVGLSAAVAKALTDNQISANIIAAYHHDHIFVNAESGERALSVLKALSKAE